MALIKDSFCQYKQQHHWQHKHHIEMNGPNDLHSRIHSMAVTCANLFSPNSTVFVYFYTLWKHMDTISRIRANTTQRHNTHKSISDIRNYHLNCSIQNPLRKISLSTTNTNSILGDKQNALKNIQSCCVWQFEAWERTEWMRKFN